MPAWSQDSTGHLVSEDSNEYKMTTPVSQSVFITWCYPSRSSRPSCIQLPAASGNNYELNPQYITMLSKFSGPESDDAYIFINEFKEVCTMMKIQQLSDNAVNLTFILFVLPDNAKKWLYSLATNSISTRAEFFAVFLKKFFLMYKTARIQSQINQFRQLVKEPFWK